MCGMIQPALRTRENNGGSGAEPRQCDDQVAYVQKDLKAMNFGGYTWVLVSFGVSQDHQIQWLTTVSNGVSHEKNP